MSINKHTLWHGIRTISTGLFIIGLIPIVFLMLAPVNIFTANAYSLYMAITFSGIIIGQIMVVKYKQYADTSETKKKQGKIYGIIGISLIVLFFLPFIATSVFNLFSR